MTKNRILDQFRPTIPLLILPTLHLVLCFALDFTISNDDGLWVWVLVAAIDLPFSLLLSSFAYLDPFLTYATLGTLWWYFIGVAFRFIRGIVSQAKSKE